VPSLLFHGRRSGSIRAVAAALALLVTLHGLGASVLATLGPLHTHKSAPSLVVLDDFRRGTWHAAVGKRAAERHGHGHAAATALRHHHAAGDASVNLAPGEAAQRLDADDAGFGTGLAAIVALVPTALAWSPQAPRDVPAARLAWVPQTHHPEPFERPPRCA
jgi:hypothetical protein